MVQPNQLVLDIAPQASYAVEDYVAGHANSAARDLLAALAWPVSVGLIIGPRGSGKTHLANIAATTVGAQADVMWYAGQNLGHVAHAGLLIVDGLQNWASADEDEIFHALEAARSAQVPTLVTSSVAPENLGLKRPDTLSRLRAGVRATLQAPDDALFAAIAVKLFTDRQLMVEPAIADYLLKRMERSYANLAQLIAAIDEQSLAAGRSITKPLAGQVLKAFELSHN